MSFSPFGIISLSLVQASSVHSRRVFSELGRRMDEERMSASSVVGLLNRIRKASALSATVSTAGHVGSEPLIPNRNRQVGLHRLADSPVEVNRDIENHCILSRAAHWPAIGDSIRSWH
jgi:hypothetical protein